MAFQTIRRKACLFVIRVGGRVEICQVTTCAIIPDPVELKGRSRHVAFLATDRFMYTCQRETIFLVQRCDVVNQPIGRSMAAGAVGSHRLLVHIGMAGNTIRIGFRKDQTRVAGSAVYDGMTPLQFKIGFVVMKTKRVKPIFPARNLGNLRFFRVNFLPKLSFNFPARRGMAGSAVDFHLSAVWVLRK